jgi:hypothetical protein
MDARNCNEHVASMLAADSTVGLLLQRLSNSRAAVLAKPGIVCSPCWGTTAEGQQGYYDPNSRRIVLCCDAHRLRKDLRDTLIHELVHAWDFGRDYSKGTYPGDAERDEIALEELGYPRQRGGLKALVDGVVPREAEDFARKWYQVGMDKFREKFGEGEKPDQLEGQKTLEISLANPDDSRKPTPFPATFNAAFLCSEIRASALGQCAPPMMSWFRKSCARKAAVEAGKKHLGMVEPGKAEEAVDQIFEVCFKDPTPIRSA